MSDTTIEALRAALLAQAADITDAIDKLDCTVLVHEYCNLRTAILALSSNSMTSYSIAGRSVTNADILELRMSARGLRDQISDLLPLSTAGTLHTTVAVGDISTME